MKSKATNLLKNVAGCSWLSEERTASAKDFNVLQPQEGEHEARSGVGPARAMGPRPRHNNKLVCPVLLARALPHLHKALAEFLASEGQLDDDLLLTTLKSFWASSQWLQRALDRLPS